MNAETMMKLIESTKTTVTLKLSRTEFESLQTILCMVLYMLVNARKGVVKLTDEQRKIGEAFLPKIRDLLRRWTLIAIETGLDEEIENGWDEEDDYE